MKIAHRVSTPVGSLILVAEDDALNLCVWEAALESHHYKYLDDCCEDLPSNDIIIQVIRQIEEYFAGKRREFSVKLRAEGSQFCSKVWRELEKIPYGQKVTYRDIAVAIGAPRACRAVGHAIGMNPLSLFIPCHRVVASVGNTVGNYAGGCEAKAFLLNLESHT